MKRKHFFKDQQFDLDLWIYDLEIHTCHLFSVGTIHCIIWQLSTKGVKRYWAENFIHKNQQSSFDLDLWPGDLKINMGHLLPMDIHCTKFGNCQAQGSKAHLVYRQTDRQVQNIMLPVFKGGGHKNILFFHQRSRTTYQLTRKPPKFLFTVLIFIEVAVPPPPSNKFNI